jgi:hypothetical protein
MLPAIAFQTNLVLMNKVIFITIAEISIDLPLRHRPDCNEKINKFILLSFKAPLGFGVPLGLHAATFIHFGVYIIKSKITFNRPV